MRSLERTRVLSIVMAGLLLPLGIIFAVYVNRPASVLPLTSTSTQSVLTAEQRQILYHGGTETPFTSELLHEKRAGTYVTADCGEPVFRSEQKFDSGTGWPSFWAPISSSSVALLSDVSLGEERTEVRSSCGEHLGHVFPDGPPPTGQRYCINGKALRFIPDTTTTVPML